MRNRWSYFRPVCDYLGVLCWVFSLLMLVPLGVCILRARTGAEEVGTHVYWIPGIVGLVLGLILKRDRHLPPLDNRRAMILCALGWIVISGIGAIPFRIALDIGFLDAYFEAVGGFTTTGITMLSGLDDLPRSILFWRSFIQWLGGLGILTFFLAILYTGGSAHRLFGAESHKVFARRPVPNLLNSLRILWLIYLAFTTVITAVLCWEGLTLFDAATHAMTALATGGYSPHDASVAYFRQAGYRHFVLIEYTIILGMLLGGINFFVHYRLLHGSVKSLWDNLEMRWWWGILLAATLLVMVGYYRRCGLEGGLAQVHETFRTSLFQVVSIATTTGFATKDIASDYFHPVSRQVFLVLMVVGGCVGSTSGGMKVLRIGVLGKMVGRQVRRAIYGPAVLNPLVVDGEVVDTEELRRIASLLFAWMGFLVFGGLVTVLLSEHGALVGASGMFSALGNIGPCYIPAGEMGSLHPIIKIVYILGMLAGRLEILPLLLFFTRRTWR